MEEPHQVKGPMVVLGIVLGIVATFVWMFIVFVIALSQENQAGRTPDWLIAVLFVAPLPLAIVLLVFRRTRQSAAGFVMGLAIGTIVLAGFCASLTLPGITA